MPKHCTVRGLLTNYNNYDKRSVFILPKDDAAQRDNWIKFIIFSYLNSLKDVYVCHKRFYRVFYSTP